MLLVLTVFIDYLNKSIVSSFSNNNNNNNTVMEGDLVETDENSGKVRLSTDEIHKILENKLNTSKYQLLSYTLKPFIEKSGLLGDHFVLNVSIKRLSEDETEESDEYSFFVKFYPSDEGAMVFAKESGMFQKEIFTNIELFEKMKEQGIEIIKHCTPDCYFQEEDRVIVFNDLTKEGFETLHILKEYDYDTILIVLKALAKLHASSLILEEKRSEELGEEYRLLNDYQEGLEETFYSDRENFINLKGVEASIKCILTEIDLFEYPEKLPSGKDFKEVVEKLCNKVYSMVKPSKKYRNVICHGDLWSANILLKFNQHRRPIDCKFVDFQMTRYLPPAHDVVSVLYLTTSRELRKHHMYELIGLYYVALETNLKLAGCDIKTILPFTDFLQSCEEQKPFALFQTATYFQLILLDGDVLENFFSNSTLRERILFDNRSTLVLANVNQNKGYRNKLEDSIRDMRDYCEWL